MAAITVVDALDVSALRLFLAVVELGSVSKAARRHGVAQPSATAKVQKLERQLGVQLLDRGPSGSVATPAGVELAPVCAGLVAAAVALVDRGEELRKEQAMLRITTTRHVADHFLPGWIVAGGFQNVRIDLVEADTLTVAHMVRAGEAAVGFTDGPAAPLGLRAKVVATERVVPVVGRSHAWYGRRRPVSGRELVATTLVTERPGSGTLDVVESALPYRSATSGPRLMAASSTVARLAALNGDGVAFLPECLVHDDLRARDLAVVPVTGVTIEQPVRAVWRGTRPAEAAARRLVDHLTRSPQT